MKRLLPVALLRERYEYCALSGVIRHRSGPNAGLQAGTIRKEDGYRVIKVPFEGRRVQIMAHVMGWAIHHGEYPEGDVDHWDTQRTNNRLKNLRDATRSQNLANRVKIGGLPKGVTFDQKHKSKPYRAQLKHAGTNRHLGNFATPKEAHQIYLVEAMKVYGAFVRA